MFLLLNAVERLLPGMVIQGGEVRLADRVDAIPPGVLNLIAVRSLQRAKNCDITWLHFLRRMRRTPAYNNVITSAKLQHLEYLLRLKAIRD